MARAKTPTYKVAFERRRKGKTNYKKRLAMVKSGQTRMVVRKSNKDVKVQFVEYQPSGDKTLVSINGGSLKKFKWTSRRNIYTAYLVGLLSAKTAIKSGIKAAIPDFGLHKVSKGSILFAVLQGAKDAGLDVNFDESMLSKDKLDNVKENYKEDFAKAKESILGGN